MPPALSRMRNAISAPPPSRFSAHPVPAHGVLGERSRWTTRGRATRRPSPRSPAPPTFTRARHREVRLAVVAARLRRERPLAAVAPVALQEHRLRGREHEVEREALARECARRSAPSSRLKRPVVDEDVGVARCAPRPAPEKARAMRWSWRSLPCAGSASAACAKRSCVGAKRLGFASAALLRRRKKVTWNPSGPRGVSRCPVTYHHSMRCPGCAPKSAGNASLRPGRTGA